MSSHDVLRAILERQQLPRPDGRPLYAYRVDEAQWRALQRAMRANANRRSPASWTSFDHGAFCLFIAEWWRRHYEGGVWRWQDALLAAGLSCTHTELCRCVERGLEYWKRPLLHDGRGRLFLVTLACEGGLPTGLLQKQGTYLRQFVRALFKEIDIFGEREPLELAQQHESFLPSSLRNEGFLRLAGSLATAVWRLRGRLPAHRVALDGLDRQLPGWRQQLPLDLDDETARDLLAGLATAARSVAEARPLLRLPLRLVASESGWQLVRQLEFERDASDESLARLLALEPDALPPRLTLQLSTAGAVPRQVAVATRQGERYRLETLSPGELAAGADAIEPISITALVDGHRLATQPLDYAVGPGELCWAFYPDAGASDRNDTTRQRWSWLGEGTLRSHRSPLLLALPRGWAAEPTSNESAVTAQGALPELGRELLLISGSVRVSTPQADDTTFLVQSGSADDDAPSYLLRGAPLAYQRSGRAPVFRGPITVHRLDQAGLWQRVNSDQLGFRADGRRRAERLDRAPFGLGTLEHHVAGQLRWRRRLTRLPSGAIHLRGGESTATIELEGFGASAAGIERAAGLAVHCDRDDEEDRLTLALDVDGGVELPGRLAVHLRWDDGTRACFDVPCPVRRGLFIDRSGAALPDGAVVAVDRLGTIALETYAPRAGDDYLLSARLRSRDAGQLLPQALELERLPCDGAHPTRFDLAHLARRLETMLAVSRDIDAELELRLLPLGDSRGRCLRVRRFAAQLRRTEDDRVTLETGDGADPARLRLEAVALWDPAMRVELVRADETPATAEAEPPRPAWRVVDPLADGTWLVLGWQGDWLRYRPLLWPVGSPPDPIDTSELPQTIAEIARIAATGRRLEAFDRLLEALADDLAHAEWAVVDRFLASMTTIPPSTFDLLGRLVEHPAALIGALLRSPAADDFDQRWDGLAQLPVFLPALPVQSWLDVARRRVAAVAQMPELSRRLLAPLAERGPDRAGALGVIAELVAEAVGLPDAGSSMNAFRSPQGLAMLRQARHDSWQRLMRQHPERRWPSWPEHEQWRRALLDGHPRLAALWSEDPCTDDSQRPLCEAPLIAAGLAASGLRPDPAARLQLGRLRAYDPQTFDTVNTPALALAVALLEPGPPR